MICLIILPLPLTPYIPYNTNIISKTKDNSSVFPDYHFKITDSDLPLSNKNYVEILIWLLVYNREKLNHNILIGTGSKTD